MKHKTNQYLIAIAKVTLLSLTLGYIFFRLKNYSTQEEFSEILNLFLSKKENLITFFILCLTASSLNWILESLKWKALIENFQEISFASSLKQTLSSLSVSLATPARIGDYAAKTLFFSSAQRKKILLYNFFSNGIQMLMTLIFGVFGLCFFIKTYAISFSSRMLILFPAFMVILLIILFRFRKKEMKFGFSIEKLFQNFWRLSTNSIIKLFLFSAFRYLIFSGMFYFVLIFLGAPIDFSHGMLLIFSMYLLVSFLPTFLLFDVVIRGGTALWIFSFAGIPAYITLGSVFLMWIFNFVLPSLLGSIYVIRFQPATK